MLQMFIFPVVDSSLNDLSLEKKRVILTRLSSVNLRLFFFGHSFYRPVSRQNRDYLNQNQYKIKITDMFIDKQKETIRSDSDLIQSDLILLSRKARVLLTADLFPAEPKEYFSKRTLTYFLYNSTG